MKIFKDRVLYDFCIGLSFRLKISLFIFLTFILASCVTVPKQTYIDKKSLPGALKAAVIVTVASPDVTHLSNSQLPFYYTLLYGYKFNWGMLGDWDSSGKIKEHIDIIGIEENIANAFMQLLREKKLFQTIEYVSDKNEENLKLSSIGYNMVIRLSLHELSIRTVTADHVKIYISMHGKMEDLASKKIIWDREEKVSSSEMELLENMEENGPKNLNATIEKAVKYLANDFIYLK